MIASTQITNTEIFAFIAVLVFKLLSRKILFVNWKDNRNCWKVDYFLRKKEISRENYSKIVGTWNFQRTFETRKRSFISAFSICMTVPLIESPRLSAFKCPKWVTYLKIAYLKPTWPSVIETFCENSYQLKDANYFGKKAPS